MRLPVLKWILTFTESDPMFWNNFVVRGHLLHFFRNYSCEVLLVFGLSLCFPFSPEKAVYFQASLQGCNRCVYPLKFCFIVDIAYGCVKLSITFVKLLSWHNWEFGSLHPIRKLPSFRVKYFKISVFKFLSYERLRYCLWKLLTVLKLAIILQLVMCK